MKRAILGILGILFSISLLAQVPNQFSYQAVIRDAEGNPMSGSHTVVISIYDQIDAGSPLYTETHDVISNEHGIFTVQLGSAVPIDESLFYESVLFLGVSVNGNEIGRSQLLSVPYAIQAGAAYRLAGSDGMGEGSGLDADLLDGKDSDEFMRINDAEFTAGDFLQYNGSTFVPAVFSYYYPDSDDDGFGQGSDFIFSPVAPEGYADNNDDCNDNSAAAYPGAEEILDGIDNNCDGETDEGFIIDEDDDGYDQDIDCDDLDPDVNPGAMEVCGDDIDNDCDGQIDEGCDADEDGIQDSYDNCPLTSNPTQEDVDNDGIGDACDTKSPLAGDIIITEFMANPDALSDFEGEWIEIYNTSAEEIDLQNLIIRDDGINQFTISTPLIIGAEDYLVLANSATALGAQSGDIDYVYSNFTLSNTEDEIVLEFNEMELFRINYDLTWGDGIIAGASSALDPAMLNAAEAGVSENWSNSTTVMDTGDLGTPGAAND